MGILDGVIKIFVGDKRKKDIKALQPIVDEINKIYPGLKNLSNDELRAKTQAFKNKIKEATKDITAKQEALARQAAEEEDIDKREDIYKEIDKLEDEKYKMEEKVLNEILPEAFAVMRETARRFKENNRLQIQKYRQQQL